jgi:hypothetical protein
VLELWQEAHEAGECGQSPKPPAAAPCDAEVEPVSERLDAGRIRRHERQNRLRQRERDVSLQPVMQPLALMPDDVLDRAHVDEDLVTAQLDRKPPQVIRPLIERAAGRHVEPCVMPVAGEDAVADRPAVHRKAHVRAPIVDGVNLIPVGEQTECVPIDVDDQPPGSAQFGERCGAYQRLGVDRSHRLLLGRGTPTP